MHSIFFDLETSDTLPLGQILNYSFIEVDEHFEIRSELSGLVRISRLQLPSPGAVLANRVHVLEHQKRATDPEKVAARKIADYLQRVLGETGGDVRLIGFNSSKFDLPYLRTTLIRNGVNPYIRSGTGHSAPKLLNGDLLHLARKLVTVNEEFALISLVEDPDTGDLKRCLTLQHLSQQLGLLSGTQTHESREDVLLTIRLARILRDRFGVDIRSFRPYEGLPFHPSARRGEVYLQRCPAYDLSVGSSYSVCAVTLLDFTGSSALWIDLDRYAAGEGRRSIIWRNTNDGWFFVEPFNGSPAHYQALAKEALDEFAGVTTQNFFSRSSCDIEQDIYRLDFDGKDIIRDAIWRGAAPRGVVSPDIKALLARHKLNSYQWGGAFDGRVESMLREYALYRYGGRAVIRKSYQGEEGDEHSDNFHPTFASYMSFVDQTLSADGGDDREILNELRSFYLQSDIFRICGKELLNESAIHVINQ